MKRIYTYILLMVCGILVTSCQKDFDGVFNAEIQDYANGGGKLYVDGEGYACWNSGDMVNINGESYPIEISGDKATITTKFDPKPNAFRAVFPASYDKENNIIALPSEQTYVEDNKGMQKVNAPMVAYTTGSEMRFFNVCSLLKLTIVGGDSEISVDKIEVENIGPNSKANLWGEVKYTQGSNGKPKVNNVNNGNTGGKAITFTIPKGKGAIAKNGKRSFYIVIPKVGGDGNRVQLSITTTYHVNGEEKTSVLTMKESKQIPINTILNLKFNLLEGGIVDWFGKGTADNPYQINSAADMALLVNRCSDKNNYKGVYFKQMENVVLDKDYKGITGFAGYYDGNEKVVEIGGSEANSNGGVFNTLGTGARISNMRVVTNIYGKELTAGGVVDLLKSGISDVEIYNCRVDGSIGGKKVGGIVGSVLGSVKIMNCVNSANIRGIDTPFVGGIIGEAKGSQTIMNCANHGDISSNDGNGGGMIGYVYSNTTIDNCYSFSTISGNGEGNGGIIGKSNIGICNINNVYVGGEKSANGKWVIGSGNATCSNVYSPSDDKNYNGCTATQYDGSWKVGDSFLYSVLSGNCEGNSDWVDWVATSSTNNQPKLNFE